MKWLHINKDLLGEPLFATPIYDDGSQRSVIAYLYGITELDSILKETGKTFAQKKMELQMLLYPELLMFMLVRGTTAMEHFTTARESVVRIHAKHQQLLAIKPDPVPATRFAASKMVRIFNSVVATLKKLANRKTKTRPVQGSLFEIVLESTINGENEKIVIACTDKNRETIETFCSKIID